MRFDKQCGPRTRILVVTPGVLLRLLNDEPFLESAGAVVFDEFHERGLESDLALGMVRLLQQTVRPDLRIVVMSATLAVEKISLYLGNCPVISSEGRQYPVEVLYEPRPQHQPWPSCCRVGGRTIARPNRGRFAGIPARNAGNSPDRTPSRRRCRETQTGRIAAARRSACGTTGRGLGANGPAQDRFGHQRGGNVGHGRRRRRRRRYRPGADDDVRRRRRLGSAAAHADLAARPTNGPAGRDERGPASVYVYGARRSQRGRPEHTEPEIRRVDMAGAVLQLLCLGETDVRASPGWNRRRKRPSRRLNCCCGAWERSMTTERPSWGERWRGCRFIHGGRLLVEGAGRGGASGLGRRPVGGARSVRSWSRAPLSGRG